jgi:hypothetical protein
MGVRERVAGELITVGLTFERLYPRYIKFFIKRVLKRYKKRGLISRYTVKSRRKGKYHYVFEIDLYKNAKGGGEKA